jgi:hypothetical protein
MEDIAKEAIQSRKSKIYVGEPLNAAVIWGEENLDPMANVAAGR